MSYLTGRMQSVKSGNTTSTPLVLTCGVLQGFAQGPLLFVLYMAGLQEIIQRHGLNADYVTPFLLDGVTIAPMRTVKLLGVYIDSDLSMSTHVNRTMSTSFYQLLRIKAVRRSLPIEAAKTDKCFHYVQGGLL